MHLNFMIGHGLELERMLNARFPMEDPADRPAPAKKKRRVSSAISVADEAPSTSTSTSTSDLAEELPAEKPDADAELAALLGGEVVAPTPLKARPRGRASMGVMRCHTCGKFNHTSRNCDEDETLMACALCGLPGHAHLGECVHKLCHLCFLPGHRAAYCPSPYGAQAQTLCLRCGSPHHDWQYCTMDPEHENAKAVFAATRCITCREYGHVNCATVLGSERFKQVCVNCGTDGHDATQCKLPKFNPHVVDANAHQPFNRRQRGCTSCGATGHGAYNCPERICFNCHKPGHNKADCPIRKGTPGNYKRDRAYQAGYGAKGTKSRDQYDRNQKAKFSSKQSDQKQSKKKPVSKPRR
jgi:hypothetical protein